MKKVILLIVAILMIFFVTTSIAYAVYGVHAIYEEDSDNCTGCHRDHSITSLSVSPTTTEEAALVATLETTESCLTCHGTAATGAYTNVEDGVFDVVGRTGEGTGTAGAILLGGGFERLGGINTYTSRHEIDGLAHTAWGGGTFGDINAPQIIMECETCHNTHGSTNYRMLNDLVNGKDVSYYVESNEEGFPSGGFVPHTSYGTYVPNFTEANYKTPGVAGQGMSGWCVACHTRLIEIQSPYDVSGDPYGPVMRYRHPVNSMSVTAYFYNSQRLSPTLTQPFLDQPGSEVQCLTCHRAHGTDAGPMSSRSLVAPTFDSALLRHTNSGVCQDCHRK